MSIKLDTLESVAKICQQIISVAESLHLAYAAKAIEQERGCQIFMEVFEETQKLGDFGAFTANCEPFVALQTQSGEELKLHFVQHFIYYKRDKNEEIERYRVAHELGHCALHWPLGDRRKRRVFATLPKIGRVYLVRYTQKEEEQADAFAILLGVHRPKIRKHRKIEIDSKVHKKVQEFTEKGILVSQKPKK